MEAAPHCQPESLDETKAPEMRGRVLARGGRLVGCQAEPPSVEMTWMSIANWYFKIGDQRIVMDSPSR